MLPATRPASRGETGRELDPISSAAAWRRSSRGCRQRLQAGDSSPRYLPRGNVRSCRCRDDVPAVEFLGDLDAEQRGIAPGSGTTCRRPSSARCRRAFACCRVDEQQLSGQALILPAHGTGEGGEDANVGQGEKISGHAGKFSRLPSRKHVKKRKMAEPRGVSPIRINLRTEA